MRNDGLDVCLFMLYKINIGYPSYYENHFTTTSRNKKQNIPPERFMANSMFDLAVLASLSPGLYSNTLAQASPVTKSRYLNLNEIHSIP